ncbi:MAG: GyrI-like domain-containing protein [Defluviitaleaceae bacterium]|nr:GyrI-like domain-containing protein [Defluviitaleaceae bacterium]
MSDEKKLSLVTFQVFQDEFEFLGVENKLSPAGNSDFGFFWDNFFKLGGYDNIDPYAADPKDTNVWYKNEAGEQIYFQGKMVKNVKKIAEGYSLVKFPASDYLILTHEWLPTFAEAQKYGIGFGRKHIKTVELPYGFAKYSDYEFHITEIEKDNANTPNGSRIEHWLPIKKLR